MRLIGPLTTTERGQTNKETPGSERVQGYLERVAKFVPVEIVAVFIFIRGFVPEPGASNALPPWAEIGLYLALVALTGAYLMKFGGENAPKKKLQVFLGMISFVVWSYGIGGPFFFDAVSTALDFRFHHPAFAGPLVAIWSLALGLFNPAR